MLAEPNCWKRRCKHYLGVIQPDGTEMTEVNNCKAFPKGIPAEIAYGNDRHLSQHPDQTNNIVFEKEVMKTKITYSEKVAQEEAFDSCSEDDKIYCGECEDDKHKSTLANRFEDEIATCDRCGQIFNVSWG